MTEPVPGVALKTATANGITMRYAEAGSGPLVLFCHGWPESWYSWRHQLTTVSAAGFRCVVPDMRGYGGTEAPAEIERYTLFHMVGDMVELVQQLGETRAVIVGHDWGAAIQRERYQRQREVERLEVGGVEDRDDGDGQQVAGDELPLELESGDEEEEMASSPSAAHAPRVRSRCKPNRSCGPTTVSRSRSYASAHGVLAQAMATAAAMMRSSPPVVSARRMSATRECSRNEPRANSRERSRAGLGVRG